MEPKIIETHESWIKPLEIGMRIYHPQGGMATITKIDEDNQNVLNGNVTLEHDKKYRNKRHSMCRVWFVYRECALKDL